MLDLLNLAFHVPKAGHVTGQKNIAFLHPVSRYSFMISWPAYIYGASHKELFYYFTILTPAKNPLSLQLKQCINQC